ncbi:MAG: TonB-dependent receptor [Sedimentisphaerales bacterium]|nr:TonB-dependent receptor [Sedimentisphaerales bacterium]MBN2842709.1 TonB-dependent receptor [Sedimentisphaerales bacterium]
MDRQLSFNSGITTKMVLGLVLLMLSVTTSVLASDNNDDTNIENMGSTEDYELIESELLLFEDIPMVYSVARSAQKYDELSVAVNVITAEDIHYSGLTSIPEILSYSLGIEVVPATRNAVRMSIGGLRYSFFDRSVVMINGRNVNSQVNGGTDFMNIPVFIEDIERIEVIRSTGGAAWGSNAFSGVINIVTKKPEDIKGFMYSGTLNHFGDYWNQVRWAQSAGDWQWKLSGGYSDWTSTENTIDDDNFVSNDFMRTKRFDGEALVTLNDLTELSFGANYHVSDIGNLYQPTLSSFYDPFAPFEKYSSKYSSQRYYARLARKKFDDYSFHLQWYGNFVHTDFNDGFKTRWMENDLEAQFDFDLDDHNLIVGTDLRQIQLKSLQDQYSYAFTEGKYEDYQVGVFLIDRWKVTDRLTLESQIREDYFTDMEESDWSGRFSVVQKIFDSYNQRVRLSAARSFRTPSYGWKYTSFHSVRSDRNIENEEIISYEAGYSIEPYNFLELNLDGYLRKYSNMIGSDMGFDPFSGPFMVITNNADIDVVGIEGKAVFDFDKSSAELWLAYEDVDVVESQASLGTVYPSGIKCGINARHKFNENWVLNANVKYSDRTKSTKAGTSTSAIDQYSLGTISLTRLLPGDKGDITVGVTNLFDDNYNLWHNSGELTETVGRTYFGRLQLKF